MVCVNIDQGVWCWRMRTPFVIINKAAHFFIPTSIPFKPPPLHIVNKCYITCEAQLVKVFTYSIISLQATDTSLFRRVRDRCLIDWHLSCAFLGLHSPVSINWLDTLSATPLVMRVSLSNISSRSNSPKFFKGSTHFTHQFSGENSIKAAKGRLMSRNQCLI